MYRFFIKEDLSKYDLSSIEYSTTAGEALNPEVFEQWKRATGLTLMEGFGQTETTLTVYNPVGTVPKTGSMGIPSPLYDVDIVLPDGTPARWAKPAKSWCARTRLCPAACSWAITGMRKRRRSPGAMGSTHRRHRLAG